jgi:general secretion pathway protein M
MANVIFERWGLNPREQRVASVFVGVAAVMLLLAVPFGLSAMVASRKTDNDDLRSALSQVQAARSQVRERQAKKDLIASRYQKRAPALAGFIEQSARGNKLEVSDSVDRPEVPIGKKYVERSTVIHLKKSGMLPISKFLETIEKSELPVAVSRLNIRKRSGEPNSYDVEVGVSAYDRNEAVPSPSPPAPSPEKKP